MLQCGFFYHSFYFQELLSEFDKLANKTITFGNISILPDGLKTEIDKFANSGLDNINFTEYEQQVSITECSVTTLQRTFFRINIKS